jgi:hypothetical protein
MSSQGFVIKAGESGHTVASDNMSVQGSQIVHLLVHDKRSLGVQTELALLGLASDAIHSKVVFRRMDIASRYLPT